MCVVCCLSCRCWDKDSKKEKTVATVTAHVDGDHTDIVMGFIKAEDAESTLLQADGKPPDYVMDFIDGKVTHTHDESRLRVIFKQAAEWSVSAIQASANSSKIKHWSRLLLGSHYFCINMDWAGVYDSPFRSGLETYLKQTGKPLRQLFDQEVSGNHHFVVEDSTKNWFSLLLV